MLKRCRLPDFSNIFIAQRSQWAHTVKTTDERSAIKSIDVRRHSDKMRSSKKKVTGDWSLKNFHKGRKNMITVVGLKKCFIFGFR